MKAGQYSDVDGTSTTKRIRSDRPFPQDIERQYTDISGTGTVHRTKAQKIRRAHRKTRVFLWELPRNRHVINLCAGDICSKRFVVYGLCGHPILSADYIVSRDGEPVYGSTGIILDNCIDVDFENLQRGFYWMHLKYTTEFETNNSEWAVIVA